MESSLSLLLPVHNAQTTLAPTVHEFLEILPELTPDFQVVIADDGSTDATIEVADELATCYPQVMIVRHATRRGRAAAIWTAFGRSRGEILLLRDDDCCVPLGEIRRLWEAVGDHDVVVGRVVPAAVKWPAWKRLDPGPSGGFHLLRRRVIEPILGSLVHQTTLLATLREQRYAWHEVELAGAGRCRRPRLRSPLAPPPGRWRADRAGGPASPDKTPGARSGPKPPNYLARLRDFALGE